MQLHNLERRFKNKDKKRVGRGGKRGKTSGRGHKGQNARAGAKKRPEERDLIKKLPKLRGRGKNLNTSTQTKPVAVNLADLQANFAKGDIVSLSALKTAGVIKKNIKEVKILGHGDINIALTVEKLPVSKTAAEAITKAGGTIES